VLNEVIGVPPGVVISVPVVVVKLVGKVGLLKGFTETPKGAGKAPG